MTIELLKQEIKTKSVSQVVNKYILSNTPQCFTTNPDLVDEIMTRISNHFNIHPKNIEIVGSAKLGISLSEERFGKAYNKGSDIDIVLVSNELFEIAWSQLLTLDFSYYKLSETQRQNLIDSYDSIHRGFISPDRLPKCDFSELWWKIFSALSNKEKYEHRKIRGRLFKNWWFVEKYYSIQISKIK